MRGCVIIGRLVEEFRGLGEHEKPVGQAWWNPELLFVVGGQFHAHPATEGGRTGPDVYGNVEHCTGHHPHELSLRLLDLIVQAAEHAACTATVVVLHEVRRSPDRSLERQLVEALEEEAAAIAEHLRRQEQHVGNGSGGDVHVVC